MYINQQIGKLGEDLACKYLKENKYTIIERNFNCKQGEVDIIAYDTYRNELVFLEVKTRFNLVYGRPSEAVSKVKQRHIISVAKYYIYKVNIKNTAIRFDVIEGFLDNNEYNINHIKQAFYI